MSYLDVRRRVHAAALRAGRDPASVIVVAVSKTKRPAEILAVYEEGHRDFGENRAQEMAEKAAFLPRDIRWHFVGALQSNKARLVRPITYLLHSMDRRSLADVWAKGLGPPPPVLVEVNIGLETQKSGIAPDETGEFVAVLETTGLEVKGLMVIPPLPAEPEDSRVHFAALRRLRDGLRGDHPGLVELSMGMTDDFEVAIEEGASIIRVGRAIFGPRD